MTWVRLKQFDDWGCKYYAAEGEGLTPHGTASVRECAWPWKREAYSVRWKDGSVSTAQVRLVQRHGTVYDHGHEYPTAWVETFFVASVNGNEVLVPVTEVEVLREEFGKSLEPHPLPEPG